MSLTETLKHQYNKARIKAKSTWENLKLDAKNKYDEAKFALVTTFKEPTATDQFNQAYKESTYIVKKAAVIVSSEFNQGMEQVRHEYQLDYEKELVKAREKGEDIDL